MHFFHPLQFLVAMFGILGTSFTLLAQNNPFSRLLYLLSPTCDVPKYNNHHWPPYRSLLH